MLMSAHVPIRLHPDNPHYYLFRGKPTVLVTSAEHYGAVVNAAFDYVAYLDALAAWRLNYTRIYPGFFPETEHKFMMNNTLGPRSANMLMPWARSAVPGYPLGGNKFDLDTWDPRYFARLSDFVAKAGERGVVIEICFYNCQYADTWPNSALYAGNNIQGIGTCDFNGAQTLDADPELAKREQAYVRKIAEETAKFDNVIYEIIDEPILFDTPPEKAGAWIQSMVDVIVEAERNLPHKHLIGQQVQGKLGGPCDFSGNPKVQVIVSQYIHDANHEQEGGMEALDQEYDHEKAIELNETDYYPTWYPGEPVACSRVEAWEFIVGGGSSFNQLNGRFTVANPAGKTADNARVCGALACLLDFMHGFEFVKMRQDRSAAVYGPRRNVYFRGISEPGAQYAFYLHHSGTEPRGSYVVEPGSYTETIVLPMPAGSYRAEWVDPASGSIVRTDRFRHGGGNRTLVTPLHAVDVALAIKRETT
jgi:hypothetical protein